MLTKCKVKFLLKFMISATLIVWILSFKLDWKEWIDILDNINYYLIALALMLHLNGFIFSALRWQSLLNSQGVNIKLLHLMDSYLVSSFYNIFLPTRIGGDIARINHLKVALNSTSKSASTVVVERIIGIIVLFIFAFIASLVRLQLTGTQSIIWIGLGFSILGGIFFCCILYLNVIAKTLHYIPSSKFRDKLLDKWTIFSKSTRSLLFNRKVLKRGFAYSFLLQVNVIVHFWLIGLALDINVSLLDYFYIIPIQHVFLMLPAINGVGIRDATNILLLGHYGVTASEAVAFSMVDLGLLFIVAAVGWLRFLIRKPIPYTVNAELYYSGSLNG